MIRIERNSFLREVSILGGNTWKNFTGIRFKFPRMHIQESRLSNSVLPDNTNTIALFKHVREVVHDRLLSVLLADMVYFKNLPSLSRFFHIKLKLFTS